MYRVRHGIEADPIASDWLRVTRQDPCGICEKPDWCCRGEKGWCCMRISSEKPIKNGGWFHRFDSDYRPPIPLKNPMKPPKKPMIDCGTMLSHWRADTSAENMKLMAEDLGVSVKALEMLRVAHANDLSYADPQWTGEAAVFPMYDATCSTGEEPCGIRLRTPEGKKFAVTGSKAGVFFPYGALLMIRCDRIFVCEGPTDTAACLDLGLFAVGRAACRGGEEVILSIIEQLSPDECIIVSDNDGPGVAGANDLMENIRIPKALFVPPGKDLRAFVAAGGTKLLLEDMLKNFIRK